MTAYPASWRWAARARLWLGAVLVSLLALAGQANAADRAQVFATNEDGFGRLLITFPGRLDLPKYSVKHDNGVLAIEFEQPVEALLPEVATAVPDYVSVARIDPDGRGLRFGLRTGFIVNRLEAGERLFIDLLPTTWQGLPPGLPPEIVAELAERAKQAALLAEQQRKAEQARILQPTASLRVGRNPTFVRLQFDWTVDTEAKYQQEGDKGLLDFDWPVPVDLYELKAALPSEVVDAQNSVGPGGSRVELTLAEGVVPRFYATSPRQFVIDIDISSENGFPAAIAADEAEKKQADAIRAALAEPPAAAPAEQDKPSAQPSQAQIELTPQVNSVGPTVRIAFPFEQDTAAAVFRRGDVVWMLFDTPVAIGRPVQSEALATVARSFDVIPAGGIQIVRVDLATERLATLGSEGRSWVLSLGDVLLAPTEPVALRRQRDDEGRFSMLADLRRPSRVHLFRDPVVGDVLRVVTAFPPSRGVVRNQRFVDFTALRSIHGLVLKPLNDTVDVALQGESAVITADGGLILSELEGVRVLDSGNASEFRAGYIDLVTAREENPQQMLHRREELVSRAAEAEGRLRDVARLNLAHFFIANRFAHEAIGVLNVLDSDLRTQDMRKRVRLARAVADVLAHRPQDALEVLATETYSGEVDAVMWRSIAKTQAGDHGGARIDAVAAADIIEAYPGWVQQKFLLSGARSAVETRDPETALRFLDRIQFALLGPEQVAEYQLLEGRVAAMEGRTEEAVDTFGQVIASEVRPARAEAVFRTLLLLDSQGRLDLEKATETLSGEVLLWRGDELEVDMQELLADLYFRSKDYRSGFLTVKQTAAFHVDSETVNGMTDRAREVFADLYLNGRADELGEVEALTLYYDFRELTPPGQRGDEMIRNLARRLVKVDLLQQAGDLLEYQIESRLSGVAQAQIAADLAVIRIADRDPEGALRVLNKTRLAAVSPLLERQRRILEARALIDADRQDLALDLLSRLRGRDVDLLRVDGYWRARNYGLASELLEVIHSPGQQDGALTEEQRMDIIKAAVGFTLANDRLGLSRLRAKFGEQMAQSAEWPMFDFVTGEVIPGSAEFNEVVRQVAGIDSLNAFLASYRATYAAGDAMTPAQAASPDSV